jgi:site-specific recombinase XerD
MIMSIEAKALLLNALERDLSILITAAEMAKVLSVVSDNLAAYTLEHNGVQMDEHDDLLSAYMAAMQIQGRSAKTIERYRYIITRMMQAVGVSTRSITVYHLRRYLADEKARGIGDRTLEGYREVYSAYFNWLQRESLIDHNPAANLGAIKYQRKVKDVYSEVDLERMKYNCKSVRDRAIISFLMATGCRISEVTQLDREDVDLRAMECKVLGKGNKERLVYFDSVTAMVLGEYLKTRLDDSPALFAGRGSDRLQPAAIRKMLRQLGTNCNIDHVHPHKFRRTLATTLIRHGMAIQEVASILGHDKLDTTMEYVILDKAEVANNYKKFS